MSMIYVYVLSILKPPIILLADDTNMLQLHSSLETLVKQMNLDLKNLPQQLKANKLSLNVTKTELFSNQVPKRLIIASNLCHMGKD